MVAVGRSLSLITFIRYEKRVQREEQIAKIRDLIGLDKVSSL